MPDHFTVARAASSLQVKWAKSEEAVLQQHWRDKSHREIAALLGRSESAVRDRCHKLGLVGAKRKPWTQEEICKVRLAYQGVTYSSDIELPALARSLGRSKAEVCDKARDLGLTKRTAAYLAPEKRRVRLPTFATDEARRAHQSAMQAQRIAASGHPRGMLGKKHSESTKARMAEGTKARAEALGPEGRAEMGRRSLRSRLAKGGGYLPRLNASWKAAWREIGGVRKFYRSRWEANYARYLQWLKDAGEILEWKHEPLTFWFEGVKRGTPSYLPDFWVKEKNGDEAYHEVKGWMDDRSKTKISRMAKYFPSVRLVVIQEKEYRAIARQMSRLIPGWEVGK